MPDINDDCYGTQISVFLTNFYTLVWKTFVLCRGNVRPSVRPRIELEFHHNWVTLTYFTAKEGSEYFFFIYGLKNCIEPSDLVHTLTQQVSWPVLIFVMVRQFLAFWWPPTLGRGSKQSSPPAGSFPSFFFTCFDIWTWNLVCTSGRWRDTPSLSIIAIRWITLQPKLGQIRFSTRMASSIIWIQQIWHLHLYSESFGPIEFCYSWAIFGPSGQRVFLTFSECFEVSTWKLVIHSVSCTTHWVHVSPEWALVTYFMFLA